MSTRSFLLSTFLHFSQKFLYQERHARYNPLERSRTRVLKDDFLFDFLFPPKKKRLFFSPNGMRNRNKLDKDKGEVEEAGGNPSDVGGERYRSWNTGIRFGGGILGRQSAFLSASIVLVCVVCSDSLLNPFVLDDVTKVVCVRVVVWADMPGSHLPVSHPLSCVVSVLVPVFAFSFIPSFLRVDFVLFFRF